MSLSAVTRFLAVFIVFATLSQCGQAAPFPWVDFCMLNTEKTTKPLYNVGCDCHCFAAVTTQYLYQCGEVTRPNGNMICMICRKFFCSNQGLKPSK